MNDDKIIAPSTCQVAGFLSHATDEGCERGVHWMDDKGRPSMSSSARGQVAGFLSHATDEGCERGVHWMNDKGRPSMSSSARGKESHATDEGCERGVHWMVDKGRPSMSSSARGSLGGAESSRADHRGIAGLHYSVDLERDTMSMSARGKESTGVPRTGGKASTTTVLHDKTDENNVHIYYSVVDPPMAQKLFDLKAFNSARTAMDNMKRLKDYASKLGKPFKLSQGSANGKNSSKAAAGSKMPLHLNLWLSVGKIPEGENVTQLVNQLKRKRAEE